MDGKLENYNYTYYYDYNESAYESAYESANESDQVCSSSAFQGSNIFLPFMYYLIFFTGFLGNLFVILVVGSKGKRGGRLVDTFVVNLALADLVFVVTLPLWAISASQGNNQWDFGPASDWLCKLSSYIISVNRFSNIFFLTCMSVDRYLAIVRLMDSRYLRSSCCIRVTCALLWMLSLLLGIPSLLYRKVGPNGACMEDSSDFFLGMTLAMVFLTFVFPVLIIVLCYGSIIMHLNKHCAAAANPRAEARRRHSLKMVLCIILAFVVSWLPFNIFKSMTVITHLSRVDLACRAQVWLINGLLVSCCLAFFNSCVNPAIYLFLDQHFRRRAGSLCRRCVGKTNLPKSFSSSASFTNAGTSESLGTSGRAQLQICRQ